MTAEMVKADPLTAQLETLKNALFPDLTHDELKLFAAVAGRSGLDPFLRQIFAIKRGGKMTIQTSIDGFRLLAQRSGKYRGHVGPFWCGFEDPIIWREVWLEKVPPAAAKVGVLHADFAGPQWAIARWDSYAQRSDKGFTGLWSKMPDLMLAKCAESLAIRQTFPAETSNLYTTEEMGQADSEPAPARSGDRRQVELRSAQLRAELEEVVARLPRKELVETGRSLLARSGASQPLLEKALEWARSKLHKAGGGVAPTAPKGGGSPSVPEEPDPNKKASPPPASHALPEKGAPGAPAGSEGAGPGSSPSASSASGSSPAPSPASPRQCLADAPAPVRLPKSVDELLAKLGRYQRPHAEKVIKGSAALDEPLEVSLAVGELLAKQHGDAVVNNWWLTVGGTVGETQDPQTRRPLLVRRTLSARETLRLLLELAPDLEPEAART